MEAGLHSTLMSHIHMHKLHIVDCGVLCTTVKHQTPDQNKLGPAKFRHFAKSYIQISNVSI